MKLKPKACMRNILETKFIRVLGFTFLLGMLLPVFPAQAKDWSEKAITAVVDRFEQTAVPLFDPETPEQKEEVKGDPFFAKIRKEQTQFSRKEQAIRTEFILNIRQKDLTDEERQKKLLDFQTKQLKRREKFSQKQQKKIAKHLEEGS